MPSSHKGTRREEEGEECERKGRGFRREKWEGGEKRDRRRREKREDRRWGGDGNQSEGDEGGRRDPGLIPKGSFHGLSGMNWTAPLRFVCIFA